ncbi:MAG TPA: hypothetical protein VGH36_13365 [Acetobacteraceae bacterium]
MDWHRLWAPSPETFRQTQLLTGLLMALFIGMAAFPQLRPYARRVCLVALAISVVAVVTLLIRGAVLR